MKSLTLILQIALYHRASDNDRRRPNVRVQSYVTWTCFFMFVESNSNAHLYQLSL